MPQNAPAPGIGKGLTGSGVIIPQTLEISSDVYASISPESGIVRDPVPVSVLRQLFGPRLPNNFPGIPIPLDLPRSNLPGPLLHVSTGLSGKYPGEEKPWVSAPRLVVQSVQLLPPVVPGGTERRILIWDSGVRLIPGLKGPKKGPQFAFTLFRVIPESEALQHIRPTTLSALHDLGYGESVSRYDLLRQGEELEATLLFPALTGLDKYAGLSSTVLSSLGVAKTGGVIAGAGKGIARVAPGKPRDC